METITNEIKEKFAVESLEAAVSKIVKFQVKFDFCKDVGNGTDFLMTLA